MKHCSNCGNENKDIARFCTKCGTTLAIPQKTTPPVPPNASATLSGEAKEFKFLCPACHRRLEASHDMVGERVDCPACGISIVIPTPKEAQSSPNPSPPLSRDAKLSERRESKSNPDASGHKYWAFISYSSKDKAWGRWLHGAIETYGIPAEFVGHHQTPEGHPAPKRFHPVFRDRDELPASADLGAVIKKALESSHYLIVICSPNAAQSQWVNKEIETFLALGRREHILAIIVDGEPNAGDARECFPPALRTFEPIAADARPEGDGKTNAKLKLLAGMLGVNFDSLKKRDAQRRKRKIILTGAAVGLLIMLVATLIGVALHQQRTAHEEKGKGAQSRYRADMLKVQSAWEQGDVPNFMALLEAQRPPLGIIDAADHRGWEWYYWLKQAHGEAFILKDENTSLNCVCFSPDGQRLVTGNDDKTVKIWDAKTGKELLTLKGHSGAVNNVCFSSDGQRLITSDDKTVKVWDANNGKELFTRKGVDYLGDGVCFSPDGKRLAFSAASATVMDLASGKKQFTIEGNGYVCFSPDGQRLISSDDITAKVWNANSGKKLLTLKGHSGLVNSACFSPDGQLLATGSADKTIKVWNANNGKELLSLTGHEGPVNSVCFSPDGQRLATGSDDKTVKVWDANSGNELFTPRGHLSKVTYVCFSPDGKLLASCDENGVVKAWYATTAETHPLTVGSGPVVISLNGKRLASTDSGMVKVWDAESGKQLLGIKIVGPVGKMCFSDDGKQLAMGAPESSPRPRHAPVQGVQTKDEEDEEEESTPNPVQGGPTQVWDMLTGKELLAIKKHTGIVKSLSFSPHGKRLALCGYNWLVWDVISDKMLIRIAERSPSLCFSPDGKRLATYGGILDAETGKRRVNLSDPSLDISSMCFSPDGKQVASGEAVWNAATGKKLFSFNGVISCFTPDGKRIAVTTRIGVKIFDAESGQELLTIKGLKSAASSIGFSADGKRLLVGHNDGKVEIWEVASSDDMANDDE